ncbi:mechanosensitive ion channel family protein [Desulfovibrio ferrophilus]|uniref:MscS Mechanosensitive ion channel n=1 Tax=Desulfovibrio ferrophilus TaxID=241368 RepID=A0A2Z6B135_9BACT|nr:mechanosensitive ion channel domain-containing protein [Desulfovibrio ferrophilus]BBD09158.1 MscS Mechanosensitive ion channel [Desulfovibrio ferrophilus]
MNLDFDVSKHSDQIIAWLTVNGIDLLMALLILLVGIWFARRVRDAAQGTLEKREVDILLSNFVGNVVFYVLVLTVLIAALGQLGVDTTSFIAIVGTLGLAIGLAVKDNLANFASGVVLILARPFTVGDYISVAGVSGTVKNVTLGNTVLSTPDNQKIIVPNTKITGDVITNATANNTRRIDLLIGIGYGDDIAKAKSVVQGLLEAESRVLDDPAYTVAVSELGDSSVNLVVRPWVKTEDYWGARFDLTERIKLALDENGISIPFPQRDIHIVSGGES